MTHHLLAPPGCGECVKQHVTAVVTTVDGDTFASTNYCATPQKVCPRADMPTGVGYHLCKEVCHQPDHAEVNAVGMAGRRARGGTLQVLGHTYACDACKAYARRWGIARLLIGDQEVPLD